MDLALEAGKLIVVAFRFLFDTAWNLGQAAKDHPWRGGVVVVFAAVCVLLSPTVAVVVALDAVIVAAAWWALERALVGVWRVRVWRDWTDRPASRTLGWERVVGRWWRPAWRSWWIYERRWHAATRESGLAVPLPNAVDQHPLIHQFRMTPFVDVLTARMLIGHTFEQWQDQVDVLATAFGAEWCKASRVRSTRGSRKGQVRTGLVRLELARDGDPLARPIPHPGPLTSAEDVDLRSIPIGITERGQVLTLPVLHSHCLFAGITGSGKGSAMWSIVLGLAPCVREGTVKLWAWDAKGGMEMEWGKDLFYRYCDSTDMQAHADQLSDLVTAMDARTAELKGTTRKMTPTVEHPLHVGIIDEFARLTAKQKDTKLERQLDSAVRDFVNVGRAPGFSLAGFLQSPTIESMRHRNEIPWRAALRLDGNRRGDMILGDGSAKRGAVCEEIPESMPGVGYRRIEGEREATRFRLYEVTDEMIVYANGHYAPLVVASD